MWCARRYIKKVFAAQKLIKIVLKQSKQTKNNITSTSHDLAVFKKTECTVINEARTGNRNFYHI